MADSRLRVVPDVTVPDWRERFGRVPAVVDAGRCASLAFNATMFLRGAQKGRRASHGEPGAMVTEAIERGLRERGLVSERFELAEFGREHARTTQVIADKFGDETWLGRDGDVR